MNLLRTLLDNLPDAIYFKDEQCRFILINKTLASKFKLSDPAQAVGKTDADFFTSAHSSQAMEDERRVMRTGEPIVGIEEEETWPDGRKTWVSTTKVPLRDEAGRIIGTFGMSRDITLHKQAEAELARAKQAAEAANEAKGAFLANVSHEIRTPLHGIKGMTELALQAKPSAKQREYLELIESSADHLSGIINDILDFSKIEAGKLDLETVRFSPRDVLKEALAPLAVRAKEKGLALESDVRPDVPEALTGDPGRLRQILVNLVGNAVKFTDRGRVSVRVSRSSGGLQVSVTDTGAGIPEDKQGLLFKAFSQVDDSAARRHGGTGLGLAISAKLVELMGGRIWLESKAGKGSTFHFTVPAGAVPLPAVPGAHEAPGTSTTSRRPLRLLLADDNAVNRKFAVALLEKRGHSVRAVASGTEVLAALDEERFDAVLLDVQMPGMDGFEATAAIRRSGLSVRIIAMTARAMKGDREKCLDAGMDGYVAKPFKAEELFQAVEGRPFDLSAALERVSGDRKLLRELAAILREDCPKLLADVESAVKRQNAGAVAESAHALKGAVGNFGPSAAFDAALELESLGRKRKLAGAKQALERLLKEVDALLTALASL
ncbi:MAG: ATP-binding protein [Elusimicrobiota bacterium]